MRTLKKAGYVAMAITYMVGIVWLDHLAQAGVLQ